MKADLHCVGAGQDLRVMIAKIANGLANIRAEMYHRVNVPVVIQEVFCERL